MSHDPNPSLTVIVPFLNEERWLPLCIGALESQTLDPARFEVLFIDNGSTDRSVEIVRAHPQIKLLTELRRDPYLARNRGIVAARARNLVFLDADCIPEAGWLEALWTTLQQSDAAIVLGYVAFPSDASMLPAQLRILLRPEVEIFGELQTKRELLWSCWQHCD